jgi:hypothetical protein
MPQVGRTRALHSHRQKSIVAERLVETKRHHSTMALTDPVAADWPNRVTEA